MKKNIKFKFFIFDLDGVLFDSKKNMENLSMVMRQA